MEVEHLTRDEMVDKIKTSLKDFRRPYLPSNRLEDDDTIKEASEIGFQLLNTLFGRHDRFNKNLLQKMSPDGEGSIQDELLAWFDETEFPKGWDPDGNVWTAAMTTPLEYQLTMQTLHQSGLWIFTNMIRHFHLSLKQDLANHRY